MKNDTIITTTPQTFTITGVLDSRTDVFRTYTLALPCIGQGGNACVYRAHADDGTGSGSLNTIIKILKPTVRDMTTCEDGEKIWFQPAGISDLDALSPAEREEILRRSDGILERRKAMMREESRMMSDLQLEGASMHIDAIIRYKNTLAIAMPYEGGRTLAEEYPGGTAVQTEDDVLSVLRDMRLFAKKIAILHAKNKLHMDISPDNIFRRTDGSIVPLDFGAVCGVKESVSAYSVKKGFSAPEVIKTSCDSFGFEADIYSVGAVLFYLLFGRTYDCNSYDDTRLSCVDSLPLNDGAKKHLRENVLAPALMVTKTMRLKDIRAFIGQLGELENLILGNGVSKMHLFSRSFAHYDAFLLRSRGKYGHMEGRCAVPFEMLFDNRLNEHLGADGKNSLLWGSGGVGKTALSVARWGRLLGDFDRNKGGVISFYVPLSDYPETADWRQGVTGVSFLLRSICRTCFGAESLTSCDSALLNGLYREFAKSGKSPEYVIFADGLDEIRCSVRGILIDEINELSLLPNLRIVVTSRNDEPRLEEFRRSEAIGIREENELLTYLKQRGFSADECREIRKNRSLVEIIRLPLFLSRIVKLHDGGISVSDITRTGQLLHRYYGEIDRIERIFKGSDTDGGEKQTFIYRFLMPYIAFRMERERRYELSIKQLQRIIKQAFADWFCSENFLEANDSQAEAVTLLYREQGTAAEKTVDVNRITELICAECCLMFVHSGEAAVTHRTLQTFFAAEHLCHMLRTALEAESAALLISALSGSFSPELTQMAGDILSETAAEHPEKDALGLLRGRAGGENARAVRNLLSICYAKDGTLDGADLSRLDLTECDLLGVSCRNATFSDAKLTDETLLGLMGNVCACAVSTDGRMALFSGRGEMLLTGTHAPSSFRRVMLDSECDMVIAARYAGNRLLTLGRKWGFLTLCIEIFGENHALQRRIPVNAEHFITSRKYPETLAEFSPDGKMLALCNASVYDRSPDEIILLDYEKEKQYSLPVKQKIKRVRFGTDCLWLIGKDGQLFRVALNQDDGEALAVVPDARYLHVYDAGVYGGKELFLIAEEKRLLLADGNRRTGCGIRYYDKKGIDYSFGESSEPLCVARYGEESAAVALFDDSGEKPPRTVYAEVKAAVSSDLALISSYEVQFGQKNKYIGLYDISHERWVYRLRDHQGVKNGMLSGRYLITYRGNEAVICDIASGRLNELSLSRPFRQLLVSDDGKRVLLSDVNAEKALELTQIGQSGTTTFRLRHEAFGVETDKTLSLLAVSPDLKSVIVKSTSHSRMRVFAVSGENYDVVSEYSLACDTSGTAQGQLLPDGRLVLLVRNKVNKRNCDLLQIVSTDRQMPPVSQDVSPYRLPDAKLLLLAHRGEASFSLVSFGQNSSDVPWEYGNAVVTLFSVENGSIVPKANKCIPCCCTSDPRFDCLTASPDKLICKQRYTDVYYSVLDLITDEQKQIYIDSLRLGGSDFRNAIGLSASCLELLRRAGGIM